MRRIRMGMVGGGEGAFIGAIHRMAANLDGQIDLVCGAFSRHSEKNKSTGQALQLEPSRVYDTFDQMFASEAQLPADQKMDFVAIVTPNHLHFQIAKQAMEHGFHVLCDKPATFNLEQAMALKKVVEESECLYGLTHTYNGYPMVKQARYMVANGDLGRVRKIVVEYFQGWLASKDNDEVKQAAWRLDPKQSGASCCMGDIGVHGANLAEYVSGLEITELCADLNSVVEGRQLDDDGAVLLRFGDQCRGVLLASQIATGEENNLKLRIYGEKASIEWQQMEPNTLWYRPLEGASQMIRAGVGNMSQSATAAMRTPSGHPEGYIEAFANIYQGFVNQIRAHNEGECTDGHDVPGINEAIRGMAFIEKSVEASESDSKWLPFSWETN